MRILKYQQNLTTTGGKTRVLEKELEKKLRDKIKQLGGRAYKFVSPGNSGVPDRIVLMPGAKIYFVEMKRPGEKTRKLQEKQIEFLKKLGFELLVISTEEELENFIGGLKHECDENRKSINEFKTKS